MKKKNTMHLSLHKINDLKKQKSAKYKYEVSWWWRWDQIQSCGFGSDPSIEMGPDSKSLIYL